MKKMMKKTLKPYVLSKDSFQINAKGQQKKITANLLVKKYSAKINNDKDDVSDLKTDHQLYNQLMNKLGYNFNDTKLLKQATTHPSAIKKIVRHDFERLEFLGDRVLGLIIAKMIYQYFPKEPEGDLAKRLAFLASREVCDQVGQKIGLQDFLVYKTTADDGSKNRKTSLLANAVEAVIGAIYLDGGIETCQKFIINWWTEWLAQKQSPPKNAKTSLQEQMQKNGYPVPEYQLIKQSGPDHNPNFIVRVSVPGFKSFNGEGATKKLAESAAAELLLASLKK